VLDVLARHADVVGDLVDLIALLGARQNAGAAQPVDRRVVGWSASKKIASLVSYVREAFGAERQINS
jgi:hypothetical protein